MSAPQSARFSHYCQGPGQFSLIILQATKGKKHCWLFTTPNGDGLILGNLTCSVHHYINHETPSFSPASAFKYNIHSFPRSAFARHTDVFIPTSTQHITRLGASSSSSASSHINRGTSKTITLRAEQRGTRDWIVRGAGHQLCVRHPHIHTHMLYGSALCYHCFLYISITANKASYC